METQTVSFESYLFNRVAFYEFEGSGYDASISMYRAYFDGNQELQLTHVYTHKMSWFCYPETPNFYVECDCGRNWAGKTVKIDLEWFMNDLEKHDCYFKHEIIQVPV